MIDERNDDWVNSLTSLGSIKDKATGVSFDRRKRLSRDVLDGAYEQNPFGRTLWEQEQHAPRQVKSGQQLQKVEWR